MKIVIPGDPIPKARARVTKKGFAYDPQWELKKRVCKYLEEEVCNFYAKDRNRIEGHKLSTAEGLEINWCFHMPIPKSFSQFKKNACKWGFIEHTSKPDRSNLEKFYEDCANGILWKDDSQITKGAVIKKYCSDDNPRTEIVMNPIPRPNEAEMNIISLFSPKEIADLVQDAQSIPMQIDPSLSSIAYFISKISDEHGDKFKKIHKNYPGHWKKFASNSYLKQD